MRLTTRARNRLPTGAFALPGRAYPIEDASHARSALQRGAQYASPAQLAVIKQKVRARYPKMRVR